MFYINDEATAALDNETEAAVISSIEDLDKSLTIIMIAHRLSTLSKCDRIIRIEAGELVDDGLPADVLPKLKLDFFNLLNNSRISLFNAVWLFWPNTITYL